MVLLFRAGGSFLAGRGGGQSAVSWSGPAVSSQLARAEVSS